jgi:hypothetical protein
MSNKYSTASFLVSFCCAALIAYRDPHSPGTRHSSPGRADHDDEASSCQRAGSASRPTSTTHIPHTSCPCRDKHNDNDALFNNDCTDRDGDDHDAWPDDRNIDNSDVYGRNLADVYNDSTYGDHVLGKRTWELLENGAKRAGSQ